MDLEKEMEKYFMKREIYLTENLKIMLGKGKEK